ncbi:MAG: nitroreductase [Longimicrobiales bacterium]
MDVFEAIKGRRSVRDFTETPVTSDVIVKLLDAAAQAPNHKMTQPWRFYVLGPKARRAYGDVLGGRKAKKIENPEAAQAVRDKVAATHERLPGMIAFAMVQDENPETAEENYAAMMMAVQNFSLAAAAEGLATHIKTGAIMQDPGAREAAGVAEVEKIVAILELGEPASMPSTKERTPASQFTIWRD